MHFLKMKDSIFFSSEGLQLKIESNCNFHASQILSQFKAIAQEKYKNKIVVLVQWLGIDWFCSG